MGRQRKKIANAAQELRIASELALVSLPGHSTTWEPLITVAQRNRRLGAPENRHELARHCLPQERGAGAPAGSGGLGGRAAFAAAGFCPRAVGAGAGETGD